PPLRGFNISSTPPIQGLTPLAIECRPSGAHADGPPFLLTPPGSPLTTSAVRHPLPFPSPPRAPAPSLPVRRACSSEVTHTMTPFAFLKARRLLPLAVLLGVGCLIAVAEGQSG